MERRHEPRRKPEELPWLATARLRPGRPVRFLNWSTRGGLIEATARLAPGSKVSLQFQGHDAPVTVTARVLRAHVAAITRAEGLRYHGAIVFDGEPGLHVGRKAGG